MTGYTNRDGSEFIPPKQAEPHTTREGFEDDDSAEMPEKCYTETQIRNMIFEAIKEFDLASKAEVALQIEARIPSIIKQSRMQSIYDN